MTKERARKLWGKGEEIIYSDVEEKPICMGRGGLAFKRTEKKKVADRKKPVEGRKKVRDEKKGEVKPPTQMKRGQVRKGEKNLSSSEQGRRNAPKPEGPRSA